ncbi:MAG: bifunctional oligoribonuclease/PAP phosphatase NrnA [Halanaerobiales bacterium]
MISLEQIREEMLKWNRFIIMGHVDPDGDCIGSLFALKWYLDSLNKSSLVLLTEELAEKYTVLGIEENDYRLFADYPLSAREDTCYIALDAGNPERLGEGAQIADKVFLINIDHHVDNPLYGRLNYVNPEKAAVGEIIYDLISLDKDYQMDRKVATAVAAAIISDTGAFRYQNTSAGVFRIMAELMKAGIDVYAINRAMFSNYRYSALKLLGEALSTLKVSADGKIAHLRVEQRMLEETGAELNDTSGLVNYARDLSGVEVGISFIEVDEKTIRVSFRSNEYCPVNEVAAFFGGGGHPRAAGCTIEETIDQAEEMVLQKVKEYV